jgi:hypothetical protein
MGEERLLDKLGMTLLRGVGSFFRTLLDSG